MQTTSAPGRAHEAPKYQALIESLSGEIQAGKFRPGERFPSEADLVKRFSVSRITAGRAVRELARSGLVDRRAGSGTYVRLGHSVPQAPNAGYFGLLFPDFRQTEIFDPITRAMAGAPEAERYPLLWGRAGDSVEGRHERALSLCQDYVRRKVQGIFFAPMELSAASGEVNLRILEEFDRAHIPVILIDRCAMPYPHRTNHDLVGIDNHRAGYLITEHLLKLGAKQVVFLAEENAASTVDARIAGFREALWNAGREGDGQSVQRLASVDIAGVQGILDATSPDAIVCANDRLASQAMRALIALGRRIPADVRLAGIDDVEYASLLPIPLTTVRQPCQAIGETAMAAMVSRIAHPEMLARDILLRCEVVIRESCGAARASHK